MSSYKLAHDPLVDGYTAVDSLRGWAVFLVIAVHTALWVAPDSPWLKTITGFGFTGVELFFLVSAMTLCMARERRIANGLDSTSGFFIRRVFRIFPMWWVAMGIYLWRSGLGPRDWVPDGITLSDIFLTALGAHGWHPSLVNAVVPIGWSVGVELSFYLLFPILVVAIYSIPRAVIFILVALGISILWRPWIISFMQGSLPETTHYVSIVRTFSGYMSLPPQLVVFGFGFLTYHIFKRTGPESSQKSGRIMLGISLLLYVLAAHNEIRAIMVKVAHSMVIYGTIYLFFSLGVLCARPRIFDNAVTRWVGKVSYSAYLLHMWIIWQLQSGHWAQAAYPIHGDLEFCITLLAVLCLTVTASSITYRVIELPMMRLGSFYSRRIANGELKMPRWRK